jgi:hypothetical protein
MLYLGIDQHARQLTVSLRDEHGDVVLARQVSTQPEKVQAFFQQLTRDRLRLDETFVAVVEVCGFNDWLIQMLHDYHCHKVRAIASNFRQKSPQSAPRLLFPSPRGGVCNGGCSNTECPASKSIGRGDATARRFRRRAPPESGSDLR